MAFQQYNVYPILSPARVVTTANQSGTYFNGTTNNGVGATFTYATGALTLDSVVIVEGDSVLLMGQTAALQNGVYICTQTGATGVAAILKRRADQQCMEQLRLGQMLTISAGTTNAGAKYVLVEPLPAALGINNLVWAAGP